MDGRAILSRLVSMPMYFWNARGTEPKVRHLGPTAQDFMAAFAVGNDDTMIGMQDADGVALAAIQGLHRIVQEKDARLAAQDSAIASLQASLDAQRTEVAAQNQEIRELQRERRAEKREVADLRRLVEGLLAGTATDPRMVHAR